MESMCSGMKNNFAYGCSALLFGHCTGLNYNSGQLFLTNWEIQLIPEIYTKPVVHKAEGTVSFYRRDYLFPSSICRSGGKIIVCCMQLFTT